MAAVARNESMVLHEKYYRVTRKGCDLCDDLKLLKSSQFVGDSVFTCITLLAGFK